MAYDPAKDTSIGAFDRLIDQLHLEVLKKTAPRPVVLVKSLQAESTFKRTIPAGAKPAASQADAVDARSLEELITEAVVSGRLSGCDGEMGLRILRSGRPLEAGFLAAIGAEV